MASYAMEKQSLALFVVTSHPSALLAAIKSAVVNKHVDTWEYDGDGDFTHSPPQWKNKAWLRPSVMSGSLTLGIIGQSGIPMSKEVYAVYHGRFLEMLLAHFDQSFSSAQATALMQPPDATK